MIGRAETATGRVGARVPLRIISVLAVVMLAAASASAAQAKKKSRSGGTVDITRAVNAPIPDATSTTNGMLVSTIQVAGKRFQGMRVRDVNVTVQTTGAAPDAAGELDARLSAPDQSTSWLFANMKGQSIGPLTLDDQSMNFIGEDPPAPNPLALVSPYVGTAQPNCVQLHGGCPLAVMNDHPVTGTWRLRIYDVNTAAGRVSTLNFWRLHVVTGKPYRTK